MAKKRTLVPFYGKQNQQLEARAALLDKLGGEENNKQAQVLREHSAALMKAKQGK